jgi:hypothetical protein
LHPQLIILCLPALRLKFKLFLSPLFHLFGARFFPFSPLPALPNTLRSTGLVSFRLIKLELETK